jgi:hypothetical protein
VGRFGTCDHDVCIGICKNFPGLILSCPVHRCCHSDCCCALVFFSMSLPAHSRPWPLIQFRDHFFTDSRTPWTSDQLVARPLPKHGTTQTQNKHIYTRHSCVVLDSNPRSRLPSERRHFMP